MPRVGRAPAPEHPLLGMPRRDAVVSVVLALGTAALFVAVANHSSRSWIQRIDDGFLRDMRSIRVAPLTWVAKNFFNVLGLVYVTLPIRVAIAGFLAMRRRWWHLSAFAGAVVMSEALIGPLKNLYDRPRPPHPLVHTSGGSFPSGHAVAASVTVLAAVIALFPEGPGRFRWGAAAVAFALLMGLSRAYLAAHWLSDAVAGVLLGTSCALVVALVVHLVRESRTRASPSQDATPTAAASAAGRRVER